MTCDYKERCGAYYSSHSCDVNYRICMLYIFRKSLTDAGLSDEFTLKKDLTNKLNDEEKK